MSNKYDIKANPGDEVYIYDQKAQTIGKGKIIQIKLTNKGVEYYVNMPSAILNSTIFKYKIEERYISTSLEDALKTLGWYQDATS